MPNTQNLKKRANNIRKNILNASRKGVTAHFGGSLSCVDILSYIYSSMIVNNTQRDRFIMSKGHCSLALYATLCEFGYITKEELLSFDDNGGNFPTHSIQNKEKGIELTSGSLGMGLSYAIGQAIALTPKKISNKIYVLVGNGETNEGSFWEAISFAGAKKINNLILVIDDNKMQLDGLSENILPISKWREKFEAFEWQAVEIDGHNFDEIIEAFNTKTEKPLVIIANTIKGKGISFMENNPKWHHSSITEEQYFQAVKELEDVIC